MVFEKVRDILVEQLDVEEDKVTMEASITDDLGADSLDVVDKHSQIPVIPRDLQMKPFSQGDRVWQLL